MEETWKRFEAWLAIHWPQGLADLSCGASAEEIEALEAGIEQKLPQDFIDFLTVHNGQRGDAGYMLRVGRFLSTNEILSEWSEWKVLLDDGAFDDCWSHPGYGVKTDWWSAGWIPFTYKLFDGFWGECVDMYCVDLDPDEEGGTFGQVMSMRREFRDRGRHSDHFSDWFTQYVDGVLSGDYVYSEEENGIVTKPDDS